MNKKWQIYVVHNNKIKCMLNNDDDKAINIFLKKVINQSKYIGDLVYVVEVRIIGLLSININSFKLSEKYTLLHRKIYEYGTLWYINEDIENNELTTSDIKKLVKTIHNNNISIVSLDDDGGAVAIRDGCY